MYSPFVVPTTLASPVDYATWTQADAPDNIAQILRGCTGLVLDATEGTFYAVDSLTGLATDATTLAALRDATCIQASAWVALKIDPATGGALTSSVRKSKKLGSGAIEYADADVKAAAAARAAAYNGLVPEARRFLQQRNLLGTEPYGAG